MRRAVALRCHCAKLEPIPGFARAPMTNLTPRGTNLDAIERLLEPKRIKDAELFGLISMPAPTSPSWGACS